jgi:ABC-type multidrug transport system ATPase subunit/ABC-type transporter Mla maintaining outer membrane lipid asymmetry permease subunit MlaE
MNVPSSPPVLSISDLTIIRPDGKLLIRDASLQLYAGEVVLLVGPVGSGKSTLLRILSGLQSNGQSGWNISGRMTMESQTTDLSHETVRAGAMVFQHAALFDDLSLSENLDISASHAASHSETADMLAGSLIGDIRQDGSVSSVSGGERQLIAIARTVISNPSVLLFDEPNSGLDPQKTLRLAKILAKIKHETRCPLLVTAHHVRHLLPIADRVVLLDSVTKRIIPLESNASVIEDNLCKSDSGTDFDRLMTADEAAPGATRSKATRSHSRCFWQWRFFSRYTWSHCFSPEALLYMALGGLLVGFVPTWFTFARFPQSNYLTPLFHEELLSGIGFAQFRILVPLMTAILLASRSAAIVAADLGHRAYSNQLDAMQNLGIPQHAYLGGNILASSIVAAMVGIGFMFVISSSISLTTWAFMFPAMSQHFWKEHFFASILKTGGAAPEGVVWIIAKTVACAVAVSVASIKIGLSSKTSVIELNRGIAIAVVTTVALVLCIHTAAALLEF